MRRCAISPGASRFAGLLAGAAVIGFLCTASPSEAVFSLSVSPDRGGQDVRFTPAQRGREVRNEEVSVTVSSDEGKRYRVTQEVLTPFVNERGEVLSPNAVQVFTPSTVRGTAKIVFPTKLTLGQSVIYTSDSAGTGDTFKMVFAFEPAADDSAGFYRAQVRYDLESTEGGVSISTVTLNLFVEIVPESLLQVKSTRGRSSLDFGTLSQRRLSVQDEIEIQIHSNTGSRYRVYQEMTQPLTNASGRTLPGRKFHGEISVSGPGTVLASAPQLIPSRVTLYESDKTGSGAHLNLLYASEELGDEIAGDYRTVLTIGIESLSGTSVFRPINLPVRLSIEPILHLEADTHAGGRLSFGRFMNAGESQVRQMTLRAINNTGERYQIIQELQRPFTDLRGVQIPSTHFTAAMKGEGKGELKVTAATSIEPGSRVLYVSDPKGSSTTLQVEYVLTLPEGQRGGDYASEIVYSIAPI